MIKWLKVIMMVFLIIVAACFAAIIASGLYVAAKVRGDSLKPSIRKLISQQTRSHQRV